MVPLFKPTPAPVYEYRLSHGQDPRAAKEANLFELDGALAWPILHCLEELQDPNYQKICLPLDGDIPNYVMTFRCPALKDFTNKQLDGLPIISFFLRDYGIWPERAFLVVQEYKKQVISKLLYRHTLIHLYDSDPEMLKALQSDRVIPHLITHQEDPFVGLVAIEAKV